MIPIRDNVPARRFPFVTFLLIAVNVVVFARELGLSPVRLDGLLQFWGVVPARLFAPRHEAFAAFPANTPLTLFSYMFLHGGWMHLVSNMWALWLFGDNVEDRLGHLRFALFYVLCGVLAILLHVLLNPTSAAPTIGASGAIAGVMGAYFLFFPRSRMIVLVPILFYPLFFEIPTALYLLLWIWSQVLSGTVALLGRAGGFGGVAFWAHVGGFFAGMLLGKGWAPHPRGRRQYYEDRGDY